MTAKLDETRAFFEEVLGLKIGPRPEFDMPVCWLYAGGRDVVVYDDRARGGWYLQR